MGEALSLERQAQVARALRAFLPARAVLWEEEDTRPYECDGLTAYRQLPMVVALPETEEQVRRILETCASMKVPVVPRGAGNALLQYDLFHMQIMEGNLAATIERLLPRIGHLQIADVPGRHEPGSGEINFDFLFRHVDALGYAGWIGCEYNPAGGTLEGLKWAKPYL